MRFHSVSNPSLFAWVLRVGVTAGEAARIGPKLIEVSMNPACCRVDCIPVSDELLGHRLQLFPAQIGVDNGRRVNQQLEHLLVNGIPWDVDADAAKELRNLLGAAQVEAGPAEQIPLNPLACRFQQ